MNAVGGRALPWHEPTMEDVMPTVEITSHGKRTPVEGDDSLANWQFNATVDGQNGIVSVYVSSNDNESAARRYALITLTQDPSKLQGILFSGGGGGGGGDGSSGGDGGGGGGFGGSIGDDDPPQSQTADGT